MALAIDDAVKTLSADVGDVSRRLSNVEGTIDEHTRRLEHHTKSLDEILTVVKQIQGTQAGLASSIGLAMTELALARSLERRVERLEAAVFPPKH